MIKEGGVCANAAATLQILNHDDPRRNVRLLPTISANLPHNNSKHPYDKLLNVISVVYSDHVARMSLTNKHSEAIASLLA